jgi:hypothetical protein
MNRIDRKQLQEAIALLEKAQEIIDAIKDGEQDKYDNLSEGLQQTEKGQRFEEAVSILEDTWSNLNEAIDNINQVIE